MIKYPKLDDKVNITPFETSSISQVYLLKTPDGRTFQISSKLCQLLLLLNGEKSIEEIASEFSSQNSKEYTADDISQIIEKLVIPRGLLLSNQAEQKTQLQTKQKSNTSLSLRLPLFSRKALFPLTNILSKLFRYPVFITLTTIALIILWIVLPKLLVYDFTKTTKMGYAWIISYVLLTISVLFHELGHASACRYYGCAHGSIGFGLYLVFPVFFVDVNEAWSLSRKQRAMIDIGGVYLQLVTTIILYFAYIVTESPILLLTIFLIYFMIFTNLNPLFKYDGYWLLSDLAGIANLRQRATELLKQLLKKDRIVSYQLSQVPLWAKSLLFGYTILSNAFFLYFGYRIAQLLTESLREYPIVLINSIPQIRRSILIFDLNTLLIYVSQIIFPIFLLLLLILRVKKLLSPAFRHLKSFVKHL